MLWPEQEDAFGDPRAERLELLRVLEEFLDLVEFSDGPSAPATSLNVTFGESGDMALRAALPKLITFDPPPCIWFMRKIQKPISSTNGRKLMSNASTRPMTSLRSRT